MLSQNGAGRRGLAHTGGGEKPRLSPTLSGAADLELTLSLPHKAAPYCNWRTGGALCKQQNQSGKTKGNLPGFNLFPTQRK